MARMTDARAVEVLLETACHSGSPLDEAIRHVVARLREPAGVGGEWVLVPREMTLEMFDAGFEAASKQYAGEPLDDTVAKVRAVYAAMLASAPQPPAEAQAQGGGEVVMVRKEVVDFLLGEGLLEGACFGDSNDEREGKYWWRRILREAVTAPPSAPVEVEAGALIQLVEGPGCLRWEDGRGFRLKDTPEWAAFYVAAKNGLAKQPAPSAPVGVEGLHPETADLVRRFAQAIAEKLAEAERKYGWDTHWKSPAWMDQCREQLVAHVAKGDPRDVAAYAAFLWHHGEPTAIAQQPAAVDGALVRGLLPEAWTQDCQGKQDYDADLVALSCRYYPPRYSKDGAHSALASIIYGDGVMDIARAEFEAETETEVKVLVEQWARQQIATVVAALTAQPGGSAQPQGGVKP